MITCCEDSGAALKTITWHGGLETESPAELLSIYLRHKMKIIKWISYAV